MLSIEQPGSISVLCLNPGGPLRARDSSFAPPVTLTRRSSARQTLTSAFRQHDTDMDGVITIQYEQFLSMVLSLKL